MSVTIYVLDTPEFSPVAHTARSAGMTVNRAGDYLALSTSAPEVVLRRAETGMRDALWYAALTGGLDGRIEEFGPEVLRLSSDRR